MYLEMRDIYSGSISKVKDRSLNTGRGSTKSEGGKCFTPTKRRGGGGGRQNNFWPR